MNKSLKFSARILILYFVYILFCSKNIYSQDDYIKYNKYIYYAHLSYWDKKIQLAYYDSAFKSVKGKGFREDAAEAAYCCYNIHEWDSINYYLEKAFKSGFHLWTFKHRIKKTSHEKEFKYLKSLEYKKVKKLYSSVKNSYKKSIKKEIKHKVLSIAFHDQLYRMFFYKTFHNKQKKLDSINVLKLNQLISTYGHLPTISEIGETNLTLYQFVYCHFEPNDDILFANELLKLYKIGEFNNLEFIFYFLDYCGTNRGIIFDIKDDKFYIKCKNIDFENNPYVQSFGMLAFFHVENGIGKKLILPVYDKIRANQIRKEYGFCSLEDETVLSHGFKTYDEDIFKQRYVVKLKK